MNYTVYGLIDPRTDNVFYVGFAGNVARRKNHHARDKSSPSYPICREIIDSGLTVGLKVFDVKTDKIEAKRLERELILTASGLVNSKNPKSMLSLLLYPR